MATLKSSRAPSIYAPACAGKENDPLRWNELDADDANAERHGRSIRNRGCRG